MHVQGCLWSAIPSPDGLLRGLGTRAALGFGAPALSGGVRIALFVSVTVPSGALEGTIRTHCRFWAGVVWCALAS